MNSLWNELGYFVQISIMYWSTSAATSFQSRQCFIWKNCSKLLPQFMRRIHDVAPFYRKVTLSSWKGHTVNDCKMYLWNLARYFALLPDHRWRKRVLQCNGTLGAEGLETYLGQYSCRFLRLKMCIYLHGGWRLWIMICGIQCFLNFEVSGNFCFACFRLLKLKWGTTATIPEGHQKIWTQGSTKCENKVPPRILPI